MDPNPAPAFRYRYECANCEKTTETENYFPAIECVCSIGVQVYKGYYSGGYFFNLLDDGYFVRSPDGNYYWCDEFGAWHKRGQQPPVQQEIASVLNDAASAEEMFPNISGAVEGCTKELQGWGLKKEGDRALALRYIGIALAGSDRGTAWKLVANWNTAYPNNKISIKQAGLRPTDDPALQVHDVAYQQVSQIPQHIVQRYNGRDHELTIFSTEGGFHLIYSPSGAQNLVPNVPNAQVLVRIPKPGAGAPTPQAGFRMGQD